MANLIDKSALIAKIKRLKNHYDSAAKEFGDEGYKDNVLMEQSKSTVCERVLSVIDTLEVKETEEKPVSKVLDDAIEYGKNIVLAELERIIKDKEEAGKNYVFMFSEVKELVKKMSQKG